MRIEVGVKTGRKESKIIKIEGNKFHVELKSSPRENKANIELIKLLSKHFRKNVVFVSGLKSRIKMLEVLD